MDLSRFVSALEAKRSEILGRRKSIAKDMVAESHADSLDEARYMEELHKSALFGNADAALLNEVHFALERVKTGEYGICQQCDEPIPEKRLNCVPWARRCVPCQEQADVSVEPESQEDTVARWEPRV